MGKRDSLLCVLVLFGHVMATDVNRRATDPVVHLTAVTSQLSDKVTQLTAQVTALKSDVTNKANQIASLTTQLKQKAASIGSLNHTLIVTANQLHAVDTYCKSKITGLTNRLITLENPVAFTARFSQNSVANRTTTVGAWHYLLFDYVQYQTGGTNYNKTTGLFTAPSAGTYAFFITVQRNDPDQNDCVEASIIRNINQYLAVVSACPSGYTASSNMAVVWLRKGDKVHVQTRTSDHIYGYVHTTFSGIKLTPH